MELPKIKLKVVEIRGQGVCSHGHQVGQEMEFTERGLDLCAFALNSLLPFYTVLKYGGKFPWEPDPDQCLVSCPDPHSTVIFRLVREKKG